MRGSHYCSLDPVNEFAAGAMGDHRQALRQPPSLPLPVITSSALKEGKHALDTLKAGDGVVMLTNFNGVYLEPSGWTRSSMSSTAALRWSSKIRRRQRYVGSRVRLDIRVR